MLYFVKSTIQRKKSGKCKLLAAVKALKVLHRLKSWSLFSLMPDIRWYLYLSAHLFLLFSDVDSPKLGSWECPRLAKVMQILIPSVEHGRTLSSLVKDKYCHWKEALERTSQTTDDSPLSSALYDVLPEADGLLISFFCVHCEINQI